MMIQRLLSVALCFVAMPLFAQDTDQEVDVQQLMQEAAMHLQGQDFAKAADVFAKVVKADPENGRAIHLYGYCLHGSGKLDEAIPIHKKAAEFEQFKGISLYNLGCAYSLKKDNDNAIKYLTQAVKAGYADLNNYESDPDLNNVRKDDRFKKVIARVKGEDVDEKKMEKKKVRPSLSGTWLMKSGKTAGTASTNFPPAISVTKETFTIPTPDPSQKFIMAYKVDASKSPMNVDFDIKEGPSKGKAQGIVKIEKGTMTLCYDPTGKSRPDDFKSTEENGYYLFVMKRKPLGVDAMVGNWDYVAGSAKGKDVAKERLAAAGVQITKDTITIPAGPDMTFVAKFKLNGESMPMKIDMEMTEGPSPDGAKAVGIVGMKNGNLVICYDPTGKNRPENFKTSSEDSFQMFTLKRKSKKADKPKAKKESPDKASENDK